MAASPASELDVPRRAGRAARPDERRQPSGRRVIFNDVTAYRRLQNELEYANRQLETAYEELQSTNEELETTNEELQSTVEELETTNEELQSTNEELETMNEELQSMNDELQTSNEELRERTDEVGAAQRVHGVGPRQPAGGVVVVDAELRVQVWNRQAEDLWGLRRDEAVGQHLLDLDIGLPVERLRPLVRAVLGAGGAGLRSTRPRRTVRSRTATPRRSAAGRPVPGRSASPTAGLDGQVSDGVAPRRPPRCDCPPSTAAGARSRCG